MSYPFGWSLTINTLVRRERWPGKAGVTCMPMVEMREHVQADQPVMRLERDEATGPLAAVPRLSLPIAIESEPLQVGERKRYEEITAGLHGTVVEITARGSVVIESQATVVAGAIGAGRQVAGPLTIWQPSEKAAVEPSTLAGALLVVPGPLNLALLRQAINAGIAGVIASSISARDFEDFLHTDLIDLLNCLNTELPLPALPPLTLLLTEGLGAFAMPGYTFDVLQQYQGATALLTGATSIRAKVYPDLVISRVESASQERQPTVIPNMTLEPGARVRVCSGNHEGAIGELNYLFTRQQVFPSGVRVHAARVRLEDGSQLVAPLPVLKRIG